jgi:hypothetical protein
MSSIPDDPQGKKRSTLQRVLKRANYVTADMETVEGDDSHDESIVIRRIHAGTIPAKNYPGSKRRRRNADPNSIAAWENEGGAVHQSNKKRG